MGLGRDRALDDRDVRHWYFETFNRRVARCPRTIKFADDFHCPVAVQAGWKLLQEKVVRGDDINPHLSRGHASLFNRDGLLAEWGVRHFHLGEVSDPCEPLFVKRTRLVVFALVDAECFCAINVYEHQPSPWEGEDIVESIHRNWPQMISRYRVNGVTGVTLSDLQRREIRRKNANVALRVRDGTVYMPISGGVVASGMNFESVRQADAGQIEIENLQTSFENSLDQVMPTLEQQGYSGEEYVEAQLKVTDVGSYQVLFPKYGVLANITQQEA